MTSLQDINYLKFCEIIECVNEDGYLSRKLTKSTVLQIIIESGFDLNYKLPINNLLYKKNSQCGNNTILHYFAEFYSSSYKNYVELFIKNGADLTLKNDDGFTPLLLAFNKDIIIDSLVLAHLERNNSTNSYCKNKISHFHVCCSTDHIKVVDFFLKAGVSISECVNADSPKYPGYTPLHFAVKHEKLQTIQLLLSKGAKWNAKDAAGVSPLHLLIKIFLEKKCDEKYIEMKKILTTAFCLNSLSLPDSVGLSNFHIAVILSKHEFFDQIGEKNMNILDSCVNLKLPMWQGYTLLHFACHVNFETFVLLLTKGANLVAKDANNQTPFDVFLKKYSLDKVIEILSVDKRHQLSQVKFTDGTLMLDALCAMKTTNDLEQFMRKKVKDANSIISLDSPVWSGCNLLHLAVIFNGSVRTLLHHNVNFTRINSEGMSPLHLAFRMKRTSIMQYIIDSYNKDLSLNLIDRDNLSHLHIFCALESNRAELLLENNADPNLPILNDIKNGDSCLLRSGSTPFHVVLRHKTHLSYLISKFLSFGANLHAPDADGVTPLQLMFKLDNFDPFLNKLMNNGKLILTTNSLQLIANALYKGRKILHDIFYETLYNGNKMSDSFRSMIENFINEKHYKQLGWTKLHVACAVNSKFMIRQQLESGANINERIAMGVPLRPGDTPLHILCDKHSWIKSDLMQLLFEYGADPTIQNKKNLTPIHFGTRGRIEEGKLKYSATLLLRSKHTKVNPANDDGLSVFHICCRDQNVSAVKKFLKSGVNVNACVKFFVHQYAGYTPLHFAVENGNDDIIQLLLDYNADPNIKNAAGLTPIHMAASLNDKLFTSDRVETFLRYSATNVQATNMLGETVLEILLNKLQSYNQTINFILNRGANINFAKFTNKKNKKSSLIVKAATKLTPQTFQNLIEKIPDLTEIDDDGQNVIHYIVLANKSTSKSIENVEVLIRKGCDINHKDNKGETVLHKVTCQLGNVSRINQLLSLGADVNMKDDKGRTPYACTTIEDNFHKIRLALASHIEKLELCGLDVDQSNKIKGNKKASKAVVSKIIAEKCKLDEKLKEIHPSFSVDYFYSQQFIADYRRMPIPMRRALQNACDLVDLSQQFPKTYSLIKLQYRNARARTRLLEPAAVAFHTIFNLFIPDLCVEFILKYLNNDELMNLIRAANGKLLLVPLPENC